MGGRNEREKERKNDRQGENLNKLGLSSAADRTEDPPRGADGQKLKVLGPDLAWTRG